MMSHEKASLITSSGFAMSPPSVAHLTSKT